MKTVVNHAIAAAILVIAATSPAYAMHAAKEAAKQVLQLSDGGTLYIFPDGLMAKEDRFGRAASQKIGTVVETTDGKKVTMTSNEVAR